MAKRTTTPIPAEVTALLRKTISADRAEAEKARDMFATALTEPLREVLLSGNIYSDIFQVVEFEPNVKPMYMLDWIVPGTEADYVAYTVPAQGELPRKLINADYVEVPTYEIGASLDWNRKFAKVGGANVVQKAQSRLEQMFTKKINDDGFHTLLMAGVDRNIVAYDAAASNGQFTKRLVSIMQLIMRRNAGGNSVTNNRGLTDIYMSLEAHEDIRNWNIDIIPDQIRARVFEANGNLKDIYGVNLHSLFELGVGQEYQNYFATDLGGSMNGSDTEILIGLDLTEEDSFVMPIHERLALEFDDDRRVRIQGLFGYMTFGTAALDGRRVLIGSL